MERRLQRELLDELPPTDPDAIRSRRDLRRVNWFMGNARILALALEESASQPVTNILELGAGDGHNILRVARRLQGKWKGRVNLTLLDQQPLLAPETGAALAKLNWEAKTACRDLFDWTSSERAESWDVILCNLFLHHFSDEQLRIVFKRIAQSARLFVACEPWRNRIAPHTTPLLWLLGCNYVTRNDARISVEAGFRDRELSVLWPTDSGFALREGRQGFFSHLFIASRRLP
jgi:hypothetical protein